MATALATLQKHRNVLLIDVVLLVALYLVPSFSHLTATPLYKFEPMRIALIIALLFTNRANAYGVSLSDRHSHSQRILVPAAGYQGRPIESAACLGRESVPTVQVSWST